jgi:hypothetical protein
MTKLAYTPQEASVEVSVALDLIKDCIRSRVLPARDAEGKPVVLHDDLAAWVASLPNWDR